MDSKQHEALVRMFYQRRLDPSNEEHALFIKGEIAKLQILDGHDAESFEEFYNKRQVQNDEKLAAEQADLVQQEQNRRIEFMNEMRARAGIQEPEVAPVAPIEAPVEAPVEPEAAPVVPEEKPVEVVEEKPKKRGRPSKKSSPL